MSSASSPLAFPFIIFLYFLTLSAATRFPFKRSDHDQHAKKLSICEADSICGVVQVNSRGLTAFPICSCPDPSDECPLVWDEEDGKSVNQGMMQYKHCQVAPTHLKPCTQDQTAYTMQIISPISKSDSTMKVSHRIHCICPHDYQHVQKGADTEQIPFIGEVNSYSLTCAAYPICEEDESCKILSETKTEFLENKLCRCANGFYCPVKGNRNSKSMDFGKGSVTQLYCQ
ncbi:unnamed protein product [Orchesella dallaii]|uniref:Uncharacterized protein n=1 Tax=Orchesella dallaii TaxID=48710 RepID=A0ABP1Q289_9HEXA